MSERKMAQLERRQFLKVLLMVGGLAGCRAADQTLQATPGPQPSSGLRFILENDAVQYGAHPGGCERTTIQGAVRDSAGAGLSGVTLRIWADDPAAATAALTDGQGMYETEVAAGLSEATYSLQIVEPATSTPLSDIVIAQAIPSCDLNLMTVNFIATP